MTVNQRQGKAMKCAVALLLLVANIAEGATSSSANDSSLNRLLRGDALGPQRLLRLRDIETSPWEFDFGLSFTDPEQPGDAWETPVSLDYSFDANDILTFSTGYVRQNDGSEDSSGADDFGVSYRHDFQPVCEVCSEVLVAGVTVPSGGSVGSNTAKQFLKLGIGYALSTEWTIGASATAIHINNPDPGVSETGGRYVVNLQKGFANQSAFVVRLLQDERDGEDATTTAEIEYDFPLGTLLSGALVVDQGLTSDHRDTYAEFDLAYKFGW